ncbi:MAG: hypothetical protein WDZ91_05985 [Paenibacillaceae bacterium]
MTFKIIPIISRGFSMRYFPIHIHGEDWSEKPHLQISKFMNASFALSMGDDGLEHLGIHQGDYLIFSLINPLLSNEMLTLVCNEEEYIIRRIPPPDDLNEGGIRIVAVLDHVLKPYDDLKLVYFQ